MDTRVQDCETEICRKIKPRELNQNPTATREGFCSWCWSDIARVQARELNLN
jgi:hypothetical protein